MGGCQQLCVDQAGSCRVLKLGAKQAPSMSEQRAVVRCCKVRTTLWRRKPLQSAHWDTLGHKVVVQQQLYSQVTCFTLFPVLELFPADQNTCGMLNKTKCGRACWCRHNPVVGRRSRPRCPDFLQRQCL